MIMRHVPGAGAPAFVGVVVDVTPTLFLFFFFFLVGASVTDGSKDTFFTGVFFSVAGVSPSSEEASSPAPLADAIMLRWARSRNVYRPRTGGDRRDRWRMLMKRLLLYTTTGCGGSERLATSNPPSYRVIFLPNTNPNCSVTSVLFERRALLFRSHARDTVYTCSRI